MSDIDSDYDDQALLRDVLETERTMLKRPFDNISKEDKSTPSANEMNTKSNKRMKVDTLKCDVCRVEFSNRRNLVRHQLAHNCVLNCSFCSRRFNRMDNLKRHCKSQHSNHVTVKKERPSSTTYQCNHCSMEFNDYGTLFDHVNRVHSLSQSGGRVPEPASISKDPIPSSSRRQVQHNEEKMETSTNDSRNSESALNNSVNNHFLYPFNEAKYDSLVFFANVKDKVKQILLSKVRSGRGIKWNLCVQVEMQRNDGNETRNVSPFFRSITYALLNTDTMNDHDLNQAFQKMQESIETFLRQGSGWYISKIIRLEIHTVAYQPVRGSSYIRLPPTLAQSRSLLNIRNRDNRCFLWCLLASIHPSKSKPSNVSNYEPYVGELDISGIQFPITPSQIDTFEKKNDGISVNVFAYEDKEIVPLKISRNVQRSHHVNLLLIRKKNKSHYCLIRDLNAFLSRTNNHRNRRFFCSYCLQSFGKQSTLENHLTACSVHGAQKTYLPTKNVDDIIKFNDDGKTLKVPFVIYADLETLNRKIHTCRPNHERSGTTHEQKLEVCGFGYEVVCSDDPTKSKSTIIYHGENATEKLLECLLKEQKEIEEILKHVEPMHLTEQEIKQTEREARCCLCRNKFSEYDRVYKKVVRHHNHINGRFIGMAHNRCNLNCKQAKHTCVVFHNLKGFDGHFITLAAAKFKDEKIRCIAQNSERYISFSIGNLRFLDSLQFLPTSLETLTENLLQDGPEAFPNLIAEFPIESERELLLRKGIYPYEYMSHESRFEEKVLPEQNLFYSSIKGENISVEDYEHAQKVYKAFNMQNLGQYHDLYLKTDVILLCDVFEAFRNVCMKQYGIDALHYYTTPGLSWDACLKMTNVSLQLVSDPDQYLFIEAGLRGGISQISNRYRKANNPYLDDYDASKPTSYLQYLDANNLYRWAMIQPLPIGGWQFLKENEMNDLEIGSIPDDSDVGYILEVSLKYPEHLHDEHNCYPLAPEKRHVSDDELSPYAQRVWRQLHGKDDMDELPPRAKVEKLITTLHDKDHYVLHYRNLQLYLKLGLKIKQVHRVLKFEQSPWMRNYINFNTEMRKQSKSVFEKNFYKLINVSVFGKTMQNVRKHMNFELVHTEKRLKKLTAKSTYKLCTIFTEDLVGVEMQRSKVKLNKPTYCGMCILDLSKVLMYSFYYNYLKAMYGDKVELQMTDTDSVLFWCETEDLYADMERNLSFFDTSEYPEGHPLRSDMNKKRLGYMKDENNGEPISEFCGLRSKLYGLKCNGDEVKRAKGINKLTLKRDLRFQQYKDTLFNESKMHSNMTQIRSYSHNVYCDYITKVSLSAFDDKGYLIDPVRSYAYGHYRIASNQ